MLMQYDADTPAGYLDQLDDDWRKTHLLAVRDAMMAVSGVSEGIGHGMLQYTREGEVFAHLNAQKGYVGVYLGELDKLDPGAAIRGGMSCGKTCLRVKKRDDPAVAARLIDVKASRPDVGAC
ncbi:MAG: DUF1801 domain-containing protein [Pseudomonadota bacterium]